MKSKEKTISIERIHKPGIESLGKQANVCRECNRHYARLHTVSFVQMKSTPLFYVDCECGGGCVTGWYATAEEAVKAWNSGKDATEKGCKGAVKRFAKIFRNAKKELLGKRG